MLSLKEADTLSLATELKSAKNAVEGKLVENLVHWKWEMSKLFLNYNIYVSFSVSVKGLTAEVEGIDYIKWQPVNIYNCQYYKY